MSEQYQRIGEDLWVRDGQRSEPQRVRVRLPACPECGGSGERIDACDEEGNFDVVPCPSCVEGVVITDELRTKVMDAIALSELLPLKERADAVLASAIRHLEGTQ